MPTVSIITPTYNRASYIAEAVESVLKQTFPDWELIVVDDGSIDNTKQVIELYTKTDKRILYIWQKNGGTVNARNTGLAQVQGKYVAFLDDDDRWLPDKLKIQVDLMETNLEIGFCYTRFQIYKKIGNSLEKTKLFPHSLARQFEDLFDNFIAPSSAMFRKTVFNQVGGFNPFYRKCEDFDFWLRAGQVCKIAPIDQVGVFTVMDGRSHDASNEIEVWKIGIDILRNLKLEPQYANYKSSVKTHIAKRYYWIGREYLDQKAYLKAALNFARAIATDPLIGLAVRGAKDRGTFAQVLKSYVAIPICLVKGLLHAKR